MFHETRAVMPCCQRASHLGGLLQDADDDVRAVAADALLPVAAKLCQCALAVRQEIVKLLWDALLDVDELSPSLGEVPSHLLG